MARICEQKEIQSLDFLASLLLRGDSFSSRKKNGKMKILTQFGIFSKIIILNIGGKKAHTQISFYEIALLNLRKTS